MLSLNWVSCRVFSQLFLKNLIKISSDKCYLYRLLIIFMAYKTIFIVLSISVLNFSDDQNNNGPFYLNQNSIAIRILMRVSVLSHFSCVGLCVTLWTAAGQAPLSGQARRLERVAMPSSRGSSWPRDPTCISCTAGGFSTAEPPGKFNLIIRIMLRIYEEKE